MTAWVRRLPPAPWAARARSLRPTQRAHVRLDAIEDGVVRLAGEHYCAAVAVSGVDIELLAPAEQEALVVSYAAFLNGLAYPVQLLVRVAPADLDGYLTALEERARDQLPEGLAVLAHDHATFVRRLADKRALLERRYYVVISAAGARDESAVQGRGARGGRASGGAGACAVPGAVRRRLTARCDEVERQFGRCGLVVRRLADVELARLFHAAWCPELSRTQRIRHTLADYTALVVGASARAVTGVSGRHRRIA
ncbi:MAG TPA: hypothetical protein VFN74_20060 [Chloroflexota bacterium]|nr:hypothetical protein [Chloroflexota bacterium]